jgi:P-loop Domain of unknown function (DUF2791)
MALTNQEAKHIFQKLFSGAVPERGLETFAVGVERPRGEIQRLLRAAREDGAGDVKFLRGGYGCGKTFISNLATLDAQRENFVTSFVVVSDNDLHFHKFDELYRKVVSGLSTAACPQGALGDIIDRWIGSLEESLIKDFGVEDDDPAFDQKVLLKLDEQLAALTGGRAPADMVRVVRELFRQKQAGNMADAAGLLAWLSGSQNVASNIKKLAGIKGDIGSNVAMDYLRGILEICKSAGYSGLLIVIDEAETILRMKGDVRGKSLNGIRQIVDASGGLPGLLWLFTGTPTFFDDRRGVKGLEPLHDRIRFQKFGDVASLKQPQLELRPFDHQRLIDVALRLRSLHPDAPPEVMEQRLPKTFIEKLVDKVTEGFHGDVGVVPRQFLRTLVNIMDILVENPTQDPWVLLGFQPEGLSPEEQSVIQGKPQALPDDETQFGGAGVDM